MVFITSVGTDRIYSHMNCFIVDITMCVSISSTIITCYDDGRGISSLCSMNLRKKKLVAPMMLEGMM